MLSPRLNAMIEVARTVGHGLGEDFSRVRELGARSKGGADFVSAADERAEETARTMLARAEPSYSFLGEEGGQHDGAADLTWIVDPLDGTTNFLWGAPLWGVNVALARGDHVIAGIIYLPMLEEMYWAEEGGGAFLNGKPIRVSNRNTLAEAVIAMGIPFNGKSGHGLFHAEFARLTEITTGIRRTGAASVDLAFVAAGRFDAYFERVVRAWDIAAGVAIINEGGGRATDGDGGPLKLHGGSVCAGAAGLVEALTAEIRAAGEDYRAKKDTG